MIRYKILFSLLLIATACNCYIFLNRDDFTFVKQSSYFDLYRPYKNPSIKSFAKVNDSTLFIKLTKPLPSAITWFVKSDNEELIAMNQAEPTVVLKQGIANYNIFSNSLPDTLTIQAEYYPIHYYNKFNNSQKCGAVIYKSDLPSSIYPESSEKWDKNTIAISEADKAALEIMLKDSIHISPDNSTAQKIRKLGCFFYRKIFKSRGVPSDSLLGLPVFQQYKAAVQGKAIWCSSYAQIFKLFADAAGIKNRYIEIKQPFGGIAGSAHVFNEYYIPEKKKWAAADMMFNNLGYKDAAGNLLNAVEVKNTDPKNTSVIVLQSCPGDSLVAVPFIHLENDFFLLYGPSCNLYYYYDIDLGRVYAFKEKIRRYFTTAAWFEIYSDNSIVDNRFFYVRQLFILLEILLVVLLFLCRVLNFGYQKFAKRK